MKKKILISTGGSGGHVIPAMALYDHLKNNFEIFLCTDERGSKFINKDKYKYEVISAPRLSTNLFRLPLTIINLVIAVVKSIFFLKNNKIDTLLGTGGYMSVPFCLASKILNIKIYLFEPNIIIGKANKFLLKLSSKIFCYSKEIIDYPSREESKKIIIEHVLRKQIYDFKAGYNKKEDNNITLLIIGGSQGAKFFDDSLKNSIIDLSKKYKLKIFHQVSLEKMQNLEKFYKENSIENKLFDFEENIFDYISSSNLAITRAGASTLSELVFLALPFIAVPYRFATDNHQLKNANYYKSKDCCWLLEEKEFNEHKLSAILTNIINNKDEYLKKKKNLEKFCYQNTWNNVNQKLIEAINEN